ncbi:YjbH domain-containing protein [Pseudomonas fluorescens]|uniref:YjbH domain-containing protein n=1 Tax=Pseudomonas fluorescens TaxID=294 RepID=UPI001242E341
MPNHHPDAKYRFTRNIWWRSTLSVNFLNSQDKLTYNALSELPRVQVDLRQHMTISHFTMSTFQASRAVHRNQHLHGIVNGKYTVFCLSGLAAMCLTAPGAIWWMGKPHQKERDESNLYKGS